MVGNKNMGRTRVKMCGFTREQDVQMAVSVGADALGFVFYPKSKRYLSIAAAAQLRAKVPAFVQTVALFVNASPDFVHQVIKQVQPDLLQFHGEESVAFCDSFAHPYIRAFRVGAPDLTTADQLLARCRRYPNAKAWLFDSYSPAYGGSGLGFDGQLLEAIHAQRESTEPPVILAGGINANNVEHQIARHTPFAIDISSAIEDSPGIKNKTKMFDFMRLMNL